MDKMPILNSVRAGNSLSSEPKIEKGQIDPERLRKVCTEFESLFINEILKFMRKSNSAFSPGGGGLGKEIYQSLFDQELSKSLAQKGTVGIGEIVYKKMIQQKEKAGLETKALSPGPSRENVGTKKE